MADVLTFSPRRRMGLVFHALVLLLLIMLAALSLARLLQAVAGPGFLVYLLAFILVAAPVPLLVYRAYALVRSSYNIEREGIRLQWGLRAEDIPMPEVLWINPAGDLDQPLPRPWLRWPGAVLGTRQVSDLGPVEYMAADARQLILIATPSRLYAISPEDPSAFLRAFQHQTELGSLSPIPPRSLEPITLLARVWTDRPARYVLLLGLLFSLGVLVWVALIIPTQSRIQLGFTPSGDPRNPVPSIRLSLLPVINTFFFVSDLLVGLFFYRRAETQNLAYLLWVAGAITSLLFLGAMYWILQTG